VKVGTSGLPRVKDVAEAVLGGHGQETETRTKVEPGGDPAPVRTRPIKSLNTESVTIGSSPKLSQVPKFDPVWQSSGNKKIVETWMPGFECPRVYVISWCDLKNLVNFVSVNPGYDLGHRLSIEIDDPQWLVRASSEDEVWVELPDRFQRQIFRKKIPKTLKVWLNLTLEGVNISD